MIAPTNRIRRAPLRSKNESGVALVVTIVFVFLALTAATALYDHVHQAWTLEESSLRIASGSDGVDRALGIAVARLQSGIPDSSPFECALRLRSTDGTAVEKFKVTHTQIDLDSWTVRAEPWSGTLSDCPVSYTSECALVSP